MFLYLFVLCSFHLQHVVGLAAQLGSVSKILLYPSSFAAKSVPFQLYL